MKIIKYNVLLFRHMGMTYFDVVKMEFGRREFSVSDLARFTNNSNVRKLLSDMKMKGLIRRTGRGTYVIPSPIKREDNRIREWKRVRNAVLKAPMEKAWTDSTAVEVWTDGAYVTAPNSYLMVYHLLVRNEDMERWKLYLKRHGVSYKGNKRVGSYVRLKGTSNLRAVIVNGEPVIPREEVVKLIKNHPGLYAEAGDLIAY